MNRKIPVAALVVAIGSVAFTTVASAQVQQAPPAAQPAAAPPPPQAAMMPRGPGPRRMRMRPIMGRRFGEVGLTAFVPQGDRSFGLIGADEFVPAVGLTMVGGRRFGPLDIGLRVDLAVGGLDTQNWEAALSNSSGLDVRLDPGVMFNVAPSVRFNLVNSRRLKAYVGVEAGFIGLNANLTDSEVCTFDAVTGEEIDCQQDSGVSYFGFSVAGTVGARFQLTRRLALVGEARYLQGVWLSRSFDDGFGSQNSADVSEMNLNFLNVTGAIRFGF